jgi:hypothetical protein
MSTLAEALAGLGIDPNKASGNMARPSDYGYRRTPQVTMPSIPQAPQVSGPVGVPSNNVKFANAVPLNVTPANGSLGGGDSGGGGIGGLFKSGAMGLLKAIDTGRAFGVSGIKELTDTIYGSRVGAALDSVMGVSDEERAKALENQGTGSWNDFVQQGKRGIGFREVMDTTSESQGTGSTGKGGLFSVAGFAGDVIGDPLTYLTLGTSTAAGGATRGSARVAIADGSGKMLSKELAETAFEKGLLEAPGVKQLVADAAVRGRGAITARGLARNGIDDATREALGIPALARTLGKDGIRIPGSTAVANLAEDFKGSVKNSLRTTDAAQSLRKLAPNPLGSRNLDRIIFSRAASVGEKFDAVATKTTINKSLAEARNWAVTAEQKIAKSPTLGKKFKALTRDEGRALTHAIETGSMDGMAPEVRAVFSQMRDELKTMGVELGDLGPNYVPHMVSDDFRALARKNAEAARVLVSLDSDVGFQMKRVYGLNPGQESKFLGETLTTGTIEELNGISVKKLGVKVFEDDVRDTLPRYISQMSEAAARAKQVQLLTDKGIVRELAVKESEVLVPRSAEEKALLKQAREQIKAARAEEKVALKDGTVLRRKELGIAREATQARRVQIGAEIDAIDNKLKDAARSRMTAETRLARATSKQESIQHSLDEWTQVVKKERGSARRKALSEVKKLESQLADVQKNLDNYTPSPGNKPLAELTARREALATEAATLKDKADELLLKVNEPGAGPLPSDRRVAQASAALQSQQLKTAGLSDEATQAASVFDAVLAEQRLTVEELNLAEAELDKIWDQATKLPGRDKAGTQELAQEYRNRVNLVREILHREGLDDASKAMATLEAQALMADVKALTAGAKVADMDAMITALSTKKFQTESTQFVNQGMKRIGETMQIPGWLEQALKVDPVRMNAVQANKYVRKFYNLWKGYAILRPGFHVRNAYTGMFNIYMEAGAGSFPNVVRAHQFDVMAMKHPDKFMEMAVKKWGPEEAEMLNAAYSAMRGTGAGQAAGEFTSGALHASKKLNPTSSDFAALKLNQRGGEWVERHLRTAHAYDVLKRGGTIDQAMDTVNKWHFNYTDISQFDQGMKLAVPFWMFYSRNIALQAQTWVRNSVKLNRTYMNVQRNWSVGQEDDPYVPEWFGEAGAIRMGGPGANGAQKYLFPDLPGVQAPSQFDELTTPWTGKFLGDVGPAKLPFELLAGKQFFSGIPFKGQPVDAGIGGQALGALGLAPTSASGKPMVDDRLQYAINTLLPGAGQLDRYAGLGGDGNAERANYSRLAALTGIGVRENNDRSRRGEQYRLKLEADKARTRERILGG